VSSSFDFAKAVSANPPAGIFRAAQAYALRAVQFDSPAVVIVLSGAKRLGAAQGKLFAPAGTFVMVHTAGQRDVENLPGDGEPYRGWALTFAWRLVELARQLLSVGPVKISGPADSLGLVATIEAPLERLLELEHRDADDAERDHLLLGVLLALARHGHTRFLDASDPRLDAQIRELVAADPSRSWSSARLERLLGLSGATIRRRLAANRTSLREVVREARLQHGLVLLQTRRLPLKSVAFASGYRSVTSFSRNFHTRYGIDPLVVSGSRDTLSA
jgi:AraC-like DNA-binding protein